MSGPLPEPGWDRLLAAARRSLERTGGKLTGTIALTAPTDDERRLIIGITGVHRPTTASRLAVRLADLDDYLRHATGTGLTDTLAATAPLRDRPGEIRQAAVARDALFSLARDSPLSGAGWFEKWLDGLRRDGTLTRLTRNPTLFTDTLTVLAALPADDEPVPVFAERVLGDTKALSTGPLRGLLLRALTLWQDIDVPAGAEGERALLEAAGIVPDDLASQVLVLGITAHGGLVADWLTQAANARIPLRLTLHQIRAAPLEIEADEIFVCENPAVLRAAAALPTSRPLICTEGVPSAAVHALLSRAPRAVIRWRNDFDWTGVRLTAGALRRYPGAQPWRMGVEDYLPCAGTGPRMLGTPAETLWEPELGHAMLTRGHLVTEERLLPELLADLTR
jgi:uncharacterized protein (TIGR02679 family)